MAISEKEKQKIQDWLTEAKRKCPACGAEKLLPVDVSQGLSSEAATEHGIDTSAAIVHHAKIVCQNRDCGFESALNNLENYGLY